MGKLLKIRDEIPKTAYADYANRLCRHFIASQTDHYSNEDILELFLFACGADAHAEMLSKELLASFGGFSQIIATPAAELRRVEGMDERMIAALKLIRESAIRLLKDEMQEKVVLSDKTALLEYCKARMRHLKIEQLHCFYLDKKHQLLADEILCEGTVDHAPVYPREIVKRTLNLGASSLILAHNHPSGDPTPSLADKRVTRDISMALAPLGIDLHDHIVIGGNRHFSFYEHGLM